jgi:hypothetical protein
MSKLIKANLKRNSFQMMFEHKVNTVFETTGNIGMLGYINGFELTENKINSIYKKIYSLRKESRQIHYYIERETWYDMRKDPRVSALFSHLGIIIHIIEDWKTFKIEEGMKFTGIVMNPPFSSTLHLQILKQVLDSVDWENNGKVVCIHPAAWLQFPTRERPQWMNGKIKDFSIIDRKTANNLFDIDSGDLVISEFCKNGKSFQMDPVNDPEFCCFKFNSRFDI